MTDRIVNVKVLKTWKNGTSKVAWKCPRCGKNIEMTAKIEEQMDGTGDREAYLCQTCLGIK